MVPEVISSSPAIIRRVVDLPHPEGPTRTMNSRSSISRLMFFTAVTPGPPFSGNTLTNFSRTTRAMRGRGWDEGFASAWLQMVLPVDLPLNRTFASRWQLQRFRVSPVSGRLIRLDRGSTRAVGGGPPTHVHFNPHVPGEFCLGSRHRGRADRGRGLFRRKG